MEIVKSAAPGGAMTTRVASERLEVAKASLPTLAFVEDAKNVRDMAQAIRHYAKQQKDGHELQNSAAEVKIRAERRMGELLAEMPKNEGQLKQGPQLQSATAGVPPTLADLGIEKTLSFRCQQIAQLPADKFESHIRDTIRKGQEVTSSAMLAAAKDEIKRIEAEERRQREKEAAEADEKARKEAAESLAAAAKEAQEAEEAEAEAEGQTLPPDAPEKDEPPAPAEPPKQPEEAQPPKRKVKTVEPGQWWRLGDHLLYCGDSSDWPNLKTHAPSAALAFADPPYNADVADWDSGFMWHHDFLADVARVVVVTPGISSVPDFFRLTSMPYKWSACCHINNGMTRGGMGFGNWIYAAIFSPDSIYRCSQDFLSISVSAADGDGEHHKGRKPLAFIRWMVELYAKRDETVIDPFLGSGTTLIACEQLGRRCVGADIRPDFCTHIIARWEALTKQEAVLQ